MTTLAWDGKTLAGDGLTTIDTTVIRSDVKKVHKIDGRDVSALVGWCGENQEAEKLLDIMRISIKGDSIDSVMEQFDKNAVLWNDLSALIIWSCKNVQRLFKIDSKCKPFEYPIDKPTAIGCGFQFALAAMDHGKTAPEAVAYAATRNVYTGGLITVVDFGE